MLTRLKAAWRVLFSEQYIVAIPGKERPPVYYRCTIGSMNDTALDLCAEAHYRLIHAEAERDSEQMNSLVSEAQAILEKKG